MKHFPTFEIALGRILRTEVRADSDSPPFDASAMDGYAMRRAAPGQSLRVIGECPGRRGLHRHDRRRRVRAHFDRRTRSWPDCDCVVKQEDVAREDDNVITNSHPAPISIRRRGENRRAGDVVVPAGTRLGPPELAALAAIGVTAPEVARLPGCAHLVTGNELIPPARTPTGAQIRDSNSTLIAALLLQPTALNSPGTPPPGMTLPLRKRPRARSRTATCC